MVPRARYQQRCETVNPVEKTAPCSSVVIHASAGVATSAQAMAWCMGDSPFVCVCSHAFSDPPSICGDSVLRCFIDCVCFIDPILMIAVCAYNLCV